MGTLLWPGAFGKGLVNCDSHNGDLSWSRFYGWGVLSAPGCDDGMKRMTVSLPDELAERVRRAAGGEGQVSAYVAAALADYQERVGLDEILAGPHLKHPFQSCGCPPCPPGRQAPARGGRRGHSRCHQGRSTAPAAHGKERQRNARTPLPARRRGTPRTTPTPKTSPGAPAAPAGKTAPTTQRP